MPAGTAEEFQNVVSLIPVDKRVWWRYHKVQAGETISSIARTYHSSPQSIAEANDLDENALTFGLRPETRLIIPIAPSSKESDTDHLRARDHALQDSQRRYGGIGGKELWRCRDDDPEMESAERQQLGGPKDFAGTCADEGGHARTEGWIEAASPSCKTAPDGATPGFVRQRSARAGFVRRCILTPGSGEERAWCWACAAQRCPSKRRADHD